MPLSVLQGAAVAGRRGFTATGTLGLLVRAARPGLVDLEDAFCRLRATTFHYREDMLPALLAKQADQKP